MMTEMQKTAELVMKYFSKKPIIPVFLGGPQIAPALKVLRQNKMSNFDFPVDAISALDSLSLGAAKPATHSASSGHASAISELVSRGTLDTKKMEMMKFEQVSDLLSEYNIPLSGVFVKDKFELAPILRKLKFENFVMKAISPDIVHKTENGAVVLNLKNSDDAEKAWDEIRRRNPEADIEGMLIQPTTQGREVIIGMKRDATFGPTILFGLGGILAEAIKDTTLRIAPVSKDEALKMMSEIKGASILNGLRGEPPVDFDTLADLIANLSRLALDHPEIAEIDLNPVMATEHGTTVVDVRIMV